VSFVPLHDTIAEACLKKKNNFKNELFAKSINIQLFLKRLF